MYIPLSIDLPTIHIFASWFYLQTTLKCYCLTLTHLQTDRMFLGIGCIYDLQVVHIYFNHFSYLPFILTVFM